MAETNQQASQIGTRLIAFTIYHINISIAEKLDFADFKSQDAPEKANSHKISMHVTIQSNPFCVCIYLQTCICWHFIL